MALMDAVLAKRCLTSLFAVPNSMSTLPNLTPLKPEVRKGARQTFRSRTLAPSRTAEGG